MKIGRLLLRLITGGLFIGHGTQKLFGWFGGYGLDATADMFDKIGARPGRINAVAASTAETAGGALLVLGAGVPFAASALTATMLTAINRVHLKNGPWNANQGYEFNLVLIAAVVALAEVGPGPLSIDGDKRHGPGWALFALVTGALGAAGAHVYSTSQAEPQTPEQGISSDAAQPETREDAVATA